VVSDFLRRWHITITFHVNAYFINVSNGNGWEKNQYIAGPFIGDVMAVSDLIVVDNIPIELNLGEFLGSQKLGRIQEEEVKGMLEEGRQLVEPKAVYSLMRVISVGDDEVGLEGGYKLESMVLADRLRPDQTVALLVVTIGPRLEEQASRYAKASVLKSFILERVGDFALRKARSSIEAKIAQQLGKISRFEPGGGTGRLFSLEQQKVLFQILDPADNIGVRLLPSLLMVPRKSSSGVYAPIEGHFSDCQYCPAKCDYRKAPFTGEYRRARQ